jgi:hypothetical protein
VERRLAALAKQRHAELLGRLEGGAEMSDADRNALLGTAREAVAETLVEATEAGTSRPEASDAETARETHDEPAEGTP